MPFNALLPYNDLPLLPPASDLESKAILKKCIRANRALAELKGAGDSIPNQSMLINAIPLQEAKMSSEIENIITTNDRLFQAAIDDSSERHDPQTKEVVRYRTALRSGFDSLRDRPLSANTMHETCGIIRNQQIGVRKIPGTTLKNPDTGEVVYTPPVGKEIIDNLLHNLDQFIHREDDDLDALIKAAVIH